MKYITRHQSKQMKMFALATILSTKQGASMTNAEIARLTQTSPTTVCRKRKDMQQMNLLGISDTGWDFLDLEVPEPTFDILSNRLFEVKHFFWEKKLIVPKKISDRLAYCSNVLYSKGKISKKGVLEKVDKYLHDIEDWIQFTVMEEAA